jgi:CMP-N,N'-diacetyllegionaminic acid synthase
MLANQRVLGLVPARGGSKGIPRKNLQRVGKMSLVALALATLRQVPEVDRILLSSDDAEIIAEGNRIGDYAPFVRPAALSEDRTPSLPVFQHALAWAEMADRCHYDWLTVLEPPCPFRLPTHIRQALKLAMQSTASSVTSLVKLGDHHPIRVKRLAEDGAVSGFCLPEPEGLRRQDQEPAFIRNGAVHVFSRETLTSGRLWGDRPYGFEMDGARFAINIDEPLDLRVANLLYEEASIKGEQSQLCVDA